MGLRPIQLSIVLGSFDPLRAEPPGSLVGGQEEHVAAQVGHCVHVVRQNLVVALGGGDIADGRTATHRARRGHRVEVPVGEDDRTPVGQQVAMKAPRHERSRCGSTNDLQTDHTPQAWARKNAGLAIRIEDVDVLCGPCNRDAGAARGPHATRGEAPSRGAHRPQGKAKFELHTGGLS